MTVDESRGCVYVIATPIGNLEDFSPRGQRVLREVGLIACEDTRRTAKLCTYFGIGTRRVSLHAHNEARRLPELLRQLARGGSLALVCDAGTPLLSDPGARLVEAALAAGSRVVPVPGASAILAALVASGLPTEPFSFVGFPPRRGTARSTWLERLRGLDGSIVLFEAPGRVAATLADLERTLGPRRVAVARELTKRFEEVVRGKLGDLDPRTLGELRGEVTLVVEGGASGVAADPDPDLSLEVDRLIDAGLADELGTREIARRAADAFGIARRDAYARVLERARERDGD